METLTRKAGCLALFLSFSLNPAIGLVNADAQSSNQKKGCTEPEGIPVDLNRESQFYRNPFAHQYYRQWLRSRVDAHVAQHPYQAWRQDHFVITEPNRDGFVSDQTRPVTMPIPTPAQTSVLATPVLSVPEPSTPAAPVEIRKAPAAATVVRTAKPRKRGFAIRQDRRRASDVGYLHSLRANWVKVQDAPPFDPSAATRFAVHSHDSHVVAASEESKPQDMGDHATVVGYANSLWSRSREEKMEKPQPPSPVIPTTRSTPSKRKHQTKVSRPALSKDVRPGNVQESPTARVDSTSATSLSEALYRGMGWRAAAPE